MTASGGGGGGDDPDAPLLPPSSNENDLRDAIGARPVREPGLYGEPPLITSEVTPVASGAIETSPKDEYPPYTPLEPKDEYPVYTPLTQEPSYAALTPPPAAAPASSGPPRRRDPVDDEDDEDAGRPRSRKPIVAMALVLVFGLGIAALVFLGRANADKYAIECEQEQVIAEQGRSFPPWGTHALGGAEWTPIAIPPEAECKPHETESADELATWYLAILVDQASTLLTAREVTKVDLAEKQLKQGLLLARSPDKRDQRKDIERLLGDVDYWRALATLRDATTKLGDAAKQFDAAAAQRPRHVSDASAWASYIRRVAEELHVGPAGAHTSIIPASPAQPAERPTAPAGTALPVEPEHPAAGSAQPPQPTPDAGVPTGGVLL